MVSMQAGRRTQIEDVDREIEAAAKGIDAQAQYARIVGIKIVLKMPHVWGHYHNVERFKQMLSDLQSDNVGVILDSTHWNVSRYDIDDYGNVFQGGCGTFTCGMLPERIRPRVTMNWKKHPERVRWTLSYWEKLCTNFKCHTHFASYG